MLPCASSPMSFVDTRGVSGTGQTVSVSLLVDLATSAYKERDEADAESRVRICREHSRNLKAIARQRLPEVPKRSACQYSTCNPSKLRICYPIGAEFVPSRVRVHDIAFAARPFFEIRHADLGVCGLISACSYFFASTVDPRRTYSPDRQYCRFVGPYSSSDPGPIVAPFVADQARLYGIGLGDICQSTAGFLEVAMRSF